MVINHLFAHSARVDGAMIAAGSPYGCGSIPQNQTIVDDQCGVNFTDFAFVRSHVQHNAGRKLIDDTAHLNGTVVHLFSGLVDSVVAKNVMTAVQEQLVSLSANVSTAFRTGAGHVWSVDHGNCTCGHTVAGTICDDINNCHYDLTGDFLTRIYGRLKGRTVPQQRFLWFKQVPQSLSLSVSSRLTTPLCHAGALSDCRRVERSRCELVVTAFGHFKVRMPLGIEEWGFVYVPQSSAHYGYETCVLTCI